MLLGATMRWRRRHPSMSVPPQMMGSFTWSNPIGSMYAIYANIYHRYTPNVSIYIYIYHTWILWE